MVSFRFSSLLALCTAAAVLAAPTDLAVVERDDAPQVFKRTTITTSSTGTAGGYWYSLWEQNNSGVTMNIGTGQYSLTWSSAAVDVVAGIGWATGSAQ